MAGLSFTLTTLKYILFFFNFIFVLVGAIVFGTGIWVLSDNSAAEMMHVATVENSDQMLHSGGALFVSVGVFIFITACFGFCGALKQNVCCLIVYSCIVGFVLFLQILAGILGIAFRSQIRSGLDESMNKTVTTLYGRYGEEDTTESYDVMQREFKCCGALHGPSDWSHSYWKMNNATDNDVVPMTCCVLKDQHSDSSEPVNATLCQEQASNIGNLTHDPDMVWDKGCKDQLHDWIGAHVATLIGVAFGLMFIEIFVIISACCLCRAIRSQYEYV